MEYVVGRQVTQGPVTPKNYTRANRVLQLAGSNRYSFLQVASGYRDSRHGRDEGSRVSLRDGCARKRFSVKARKIFALAGERNFFRKWALRGTAQP